MASCDGESGGGENGGSDERRAANSKVEPFLSALSIELPHPPRALALPFTAGLPQRSRLRGWLERRRTCTFHFGFTEAVTDRRDLRGKFIWDADADRLLASMCSLRAVVVGRRWLLAGVYGTNGGVGESGGGVNSGGENGGGETGGEIGGSSSLVPLVARSPIAAFPLSSGRRTERRAERRAERRRVEKQKAERQAERRQSERRERRSSRGKPTSRFQGGRQRLGGDAEQLAVQVTAQVTAQLTAKRAARRAARRAQRRDEIRRLTPRQLAARRHRHRQHFEAERRLQREEEEKARAQQAMKRRERHKSRQEEGLPGLAEARR